MSIQLDAYESAILSAQSERGKIAVPTDHRLRRPGDTGALERLVKRKLITLIDQTVLPHLAEEPGFAHLAVVPMDIYQVTPFGQQALAGVPTEDAP